MNYTPGAVVDIVTRKGLSSAITQNAVSDKNGGVIYNGYLVRNNDHRHLIDDFVTWTNDDIVLVHENERAAILTDGYNNGVIFFKDDYGLTVRMIDHHGYGKTVKSVEAGLRLAILYLKQNGLQELADGVSNSNSLPAIAYVEALKEILNAD